MHRLIYALICAVVFTSQGAFSDPIKETTYFQHGLGEESQVSLTYQYLGEIFVLHDLQVSFKDDGSFSEAPGKASYSYSDVKMIYEGPPNLTRSDRTADGFRAYIDRRIIIEFTDGGRMTLTQSAEELLAGFEAPEVSGYQVFLMNPPRPEDPEKTKLRPHYFVHVLGYGDKFYRYTYPTDETLEARLRDVLALKRHSQLSQAGARFAICKGILYPKFSVIDGGIK